MKKQALKNDSPYWIWKNLLASWMLIFFFFGSVFDGHSETHLIQQQRKLSGIVVDESGESIIGASIKLVGTTSGTVSDLDGKFNLTVSSAGGSLEIYYLGYKSQTVKFNSGTSFLRVVLAENSKLLDEVVIVGFGTQKKATVTGAVSMLQTKDLIQSPQANVSNMLAGRMPGLLSVQRSGEPGYDESTLRIRGIGTFADGNGSQDPLIMVDGIETSNFNNIDPNEIESLSVLKDASATAVYGVRGANGVILITTKRGFDGKPQISYSGNIAMNSFTDIRETMNAYDYTTHANKALMYDAYITGGYTEKYSAEAIEKYRTGEDPLFYPDINWYDYLLRDRSFTTQHNINVSGGAPKVKYFVSAGYYNQEGLFDQTSVLDGYDVQSAYRRINLRANLDFEVTKQLSIKVNFATQMENRYGNAGTTNTIMDGIAKTNPISTPGVVDGKIVSLVGMKNNPVLGFYQNGYRNDYRNTLNGSVHISYSFDPWVKGLVAHAKLSYENYYRNEQKYFKSPVKYKLLDVRNENNEREIVFQPEQLDGPFTFGPTSGKNRRTYVEYGLNYARTLGDHNFTLLALYNQSRRVDPGLSFKIPNSYQGIVGRVTYSYKNRYLAEFNAGYNGTENFIEGKRFGFFPAFSAGWIVSEESFFPKTEIVSFLKFRGSYGEVGNDRIGNDRFLYLPTAYDLPGLSSTNGYWFGEVGSSYAQYAVSNEGKIGNPGLTWERAKKTDIGGEISFWGNRIRVSADYFIEKRNNILANRNTVPALFGGNLPAYNLGEMKNSGWDGDITFRDKFRGLNYWLRANYTYAHNVVEYQDEVERPFTYQNKTSQMVGQYFGLICDGIYNTWEEVNSPNRPKSSWNNDRIQPGDLIYRDINGDGIIDGDDSVPIGYANFPEIVYGFSFGGDWKNWDFSVLFQGADHVSLSYGRYDTRGFEEEFAASEYLKKSWSHERYANGQAIEFPRLSEGAANNTHNYQASTFWIRDASYLRLKNVEIGYTIPEKALKKVGLSSIRFYLNGSNLYTWDNMLPSVDPETAEQPVNSTPYPLTRVFNFGVNLRF